MRLVMVAEYDAPEASEAIRERMAEFAGKVRDESPYEVVGMHVAIRETADAVMACLAPTETP